MRDFMMKTIVSVLTLLIWMSTACRAGTKLDDLQPCDERIIGTKIIENLLGREYRIHGGDKGLHYAEACAVVGALRFADQIEDHALAERIIGRYETFLKPDSFLISRHPHVDQNVMGIVPLQIYLYNGDKRFLVVGLTFADSQWDNPRQDGLTSQTRWWIDDMYMVGMLQMQAYRATNDIKYADRAALQLTAYLKRLQQPNGLFFHGPQYPYHWGRGNGWMASGMAEVLKSLPPNHALRSELLKGYKKIMAALLTFQSDNGMWRQLVDYPYSWAESSCTAMFAYAMAVGVHHGWLDKSTYQPAVEKAWKALCGHIDRDGNLREICMGTGQTDDIEYYLKRPRILGDLHGQSPLLWLISERVF
jgi:unsaturated rhamnogalacturonyl hydrolase